jgi:hypothetical protein
MTKEELKTFLPRKSGVVLKVEAKKKSSIILLDANEHNIHTHTYVVFSMGPLVTDLELNEEVYPMTAVLGKLEVEDSDNNESYYYCEESFIKLRQTKV